jgi:hypothetical protein
MIVDVLFISYNRKKEVEYNIVKMGKYSLINKIICVDNGSVDGTDEIFSNISSQKIEFIKLSKNIGIEAYNIGAKKSNADILIILDDDSHIEEDIIPEVIKRFREDLKLGVLAFSIVLKETGENVTKDWEKGNVTSFWGCGAAIRKSVWDDLEGYNKDLFLYTNEYELSIRCWNIGYKVIYDSSIIAYHRVSNMNRTTKRLIIYSIRNNTYFIKTYFDKKYHIKLLLIDRINWFIRSIMCNSVKSFLYGLVEARRFTNCIINNPVDHDIQKFYLYNSRLFELPLKKLKRKIKDGTIFNKQNLI